MANNSNFVLDVTGNSCHNDNVSQIKLFAKKKTQPFHGLLV